MPSRAEETVTKQLPHEIVEELAAQKAEDVAAAVDGGIVIGADTIVWLDGHMLGKPRDREHARRMLRALQGNTHSVFTGVTVVVKDGADVKRHVFSCETKVHILPMTDEEIEGYLDTGEPMDKAGAYGIQGRFAAWVESIEGDYNNVVGLPVSALYQVLKAYL